MIQAELTELLLEKAVLLFRRECPKSNKHCHPDEWKDPQVLVYEMVRQAHHDN